MNDGVVVLEPGDDRAKKIGRAIASETAGDVVAILRERDEATLSEIAAGLGIPMTSAKYHVEHLLDADMIRIVRTKYSEKGREVKVYGVRDQIVIVNPGTATPTDVRRLLLKYASLFCLLGLATLLLTVAFPVFFAGDAPVGFSAGGGEADLMMTGVPESDATGAEAALRMVKAVPETLAAPDVAPAVISDLASARAPLIPASPVHDVVVWFFAGGCLVLLVMVVYEIVFWQMSLRNQRGRRE